MEVVEGGGSGGLLPHYEATPGTVEASAEELDGNHGRLSTLAAALLAHVPAVSAVAGPLAGPMSGAASENVIRALYAAGGLPTSVAIAFPDYHLWRSPQRHGAVPEPGAATVAVIDDLLSTRRSR